MSILEEIKSLKEAAPSFKYGWIESDTRTPAHSFYSFFYYRQTDNHIITFVCRDYKKQDAIANFMESLLTLSLNLDDSRGIQKFQLTTHGSVENFTSVILLKPSYHEYLAEKPSLHALTVAAFPCYDCEFSGDESKDEFQYMRKHTVCTIDWNRPASPKIKIRFHNGKTKGGTGGRKFVITSHSIFELEIKNLIDSPSSFVEIENFCGNKLLLRSQGLQISIDNGPQSLDLNQALGCANRFVTQGQI